MDEAGVVLTMFVGHKTKYGAGIARSRVRAVIADALLSQGVGGWTETEARGRWEGGAELSTRVEIWAPEPSRPEEARVRLACGRIARELKQSAVLLISTCASSEFIEPEIEPS